MQASSWVGGMVSKRGNAERQISASKNHNTKEDMKTHVEEDDEERSQQFRPGEEAREGES